MGREIVPPPPPSAEGEGVGVDGMKRGKRGKVGPVQCRPMLLFFKKKKRKGGGRTEFKVAGSRRGKVDWGVKRKKKREKIGAWVEKGGIVRF